MTREGELEAVRQKGKRVRATYLEVRVIASLLRRVRSGVIVPKYGHNSVERNLVKRRLRSLIRCELLPSLRTHEAASGTALECVVRAMPSAYGASYEALAGDVARVIARIAPPRDPSPPATPSPSSSSRAG